MNINRQIEELAKIDGWRIVRPESIYKGYIIRKDAMEPYNFDRLLECGDLHYFDKTIEFPDDDDAFPDYLNSHDAIQRVIDRMSYDTLVDYETSLSKVFGCFPDCVPSLKATPAQKAEAVLKALGRWDTSSREEEK